MCLKEGGHLCIAWTRPVQDQEMQLEAEHVDGNWKENETDASRDPMLDIDFLKI
jgi:hypothetical protein